MKIRIRKWGKSKVIVLPSEFCKFHNLKEGDWVDISDIVKVEKKK